MTNPALLLHHGQGPAALTRRNAVPRVRPGDRPVALHANLPPARLRQLRRRAHACGLGVDAYSGILLEYDRLCSLVSADVLKAFADDDSGGPASQIAPPELRSWQRMLAGRSTPAPDDLPTIMIPLRLVTAIPPRDRQTILAHALALDEDVAQQALALELHSAMAGMVMQAWVLARIISSASGGATARI